MVSARAWGLLAVLALVGLAAGGLAHDGAASLEAVTTAGPEGEVPAGVPVTLGWVLTNDEGQPAFHQDARFQVRHEGETLVATTPASGHDYDGVDPYQLVFPSPGNFTLTATVDHDGETQRLEYEGHVTPAPEKALDVRLRAPNETRPGQLNEITAVVEGPDGEPVEDAEVTIRVQRSVDRFEVLQTRLAAEDGEPTLRYAFDRTGGFHVTAVATSLPGGEELSPASAEHTIEVSGPAAPSPGAPVERPLVNARETGEQGETGYELFGTYDPYTSVGPHGRVRLGMLTLAEATHTPVPDVHYRATILDPGDEQVFHSSNLDAADGFEYVTLNRPEPGTYTMRVDAAKGNWSDHTVLEFTVLPPAGATNAGPLFASPNASTSLEASSPTQLPIYVEDGAGVPLLHGEVDLRLVDAETGVPSLTGKLHVHENGTFPVTVNPPEAGDYQLQLLPQSLQPTPTPYTYGEEVGQPPVFDVDVQATDAVEELEEQSQSDAEDREETPAPGLAATSVAVLASLAARRRSP